MAIRWRPCGHHKLVGHDPDMLTAMLRLCPDTLAGKRDCALLAPDGLRVQIRRSETDQEGEGTRRGPRSPSPAVIASARSTRCRRGLQRRRSAAGRCSVRC
jgi:hypothetical protein